MGDHARGDCKKAICSSEEEELQQHGVYNNFVHVAPITYAMMAHLDINEKRFPVPGTSGEALLSKPALPMPPTADDTDRQFWAEDEMSSSESRLHLVCKQRRRRSVAYRNRVAIRKRSRSLLRQSSSSNSDPAIRMKIMSPMIGCGAHRRRRCNQEQGSPLTKKSRELSNDPTVRASGSRPPLDAKLIGCNLPSGLQYPNSRGQMKTPGTSVPRSKSRRRRSQTPSTCPHSNNVPRTIELIDNDQYEEQKLCPPSKSNRK